MCIPCRAAGCPRIRKSGYYTAVFHAHEWTRQDKAEGYTQLKNLCAEYSDEIVSFEEYCKRSKGKESLQILSERFYLLYEYWVKPTLRPVVRKIKAIIN